MRGYPKDAKGSLTENRDGDQLIKDQFSRRLYKALVDKDMTQSELARRAGLNRAAISTYTTARSLPTPANLAAIAKTLGLASEELLPPISEIMSDVAAPIDTCSFKEVGNGQVRLQINKIVSMNTALEVIGLIGLINHAESKAAN